VEEVGKHVKLTIIISEGKITGRARHSYEDIIKIDLKVGLKLGKLTYLRQDESSVSLQIRECLDNLGDFLLLNESTISLN